MEVVKSGQKQEKKPTNEQLKRRIANAIVLVEKDKETKSIYFSDKGLRITVTLTHAIIETLSHRHVFDILTASGNISRPYIYTKQFLEIALANDCTVYGKDGNAFYSYSRLSKILQDKEDKTEYNIFWFVDMWLFNIFAPLYEIDENDAASFLVFERYAHGLSRNHVILDEHTADVTTKDFLIEISKIQAEIFSADFTKRLESRYRSVMDDVYANMKPQVLFKAKTDEEVVKEEMEALEQQAQERAMEEQANGEQKE